MHAMGNGNGANNAGAGKIVSNCLVRQLGVLFGGRDFVIAGNFHERNCIKQSREIVNIVLLRQVKNLNSAKSATRPIPTRSLPQ